MQCLSGNIARFCALLRDEHAFAIGHAEARDALRAVEAAGVTDAARFRAALRLVCCGNREDIVTFERVFEAFFTVAGPGLPQPAYRPRHTRPDERAAAPDAPARTRKNGAPAPQDDAPEGAAGEVAERRPTGEEDDAASAWQSMRARYSPTAGSAPPPELGEACSAAMSAAAERLIASVRLGRTRRWKAQERGARVDLRRTIRASLQTGGDAVVLRMLGHPSRNPRFVVLLDGSRSMADHSAASVHFSRALTRRCARTNVFFFSTALREVTRELRAATRSAGRLGDLGEAWGGGTKISASLALFAREHGRRLLDRETVVIIFSDGLDVGDVAHLEGALRTIAGRSAALVWLNPHAASPGFVPAARAMRAALPFVSLLTAANDAPGFVALARALTRHPRIHGRRR